MQLPRRRDIDNITIANAANKVNANDKANKSYLI